MIANEAHRQKGKKKRHDAEEERMEGRSVSHGDRAFSGWLADWLIDDPVAMLTDYDEGACYTTVQLHN